MFALFLRKVRTRECVFVWAGRVQSRWLRNFCIRCPLQPVLKQRMTSTSPQKPHSFFRIPHSDASLPGCNRSSSWSISYRSSFLAGCNKSSSTDSTLKLSSAHHLCSPLCFLWQSVKRCLSWSPCFHSRSCRFSVSDSHLLIFLDCLSWSPCFHSRSCRISFSHSHLLIFLDCLSWSPCFHSRSCRISVSHSHLLIFLDCLSWSPCFHSRSCRISFSDSHLVVPSLQS